MQKDYGRGVLLWGAISLLSMGGALAADIHQPQPLRNGSIFQPLVAGSAPWVQTAAASVSRTGTGLSSTAGPSKHTDGPHLRLALAPSASDGAVAGEASSMLPSGSVSTAAVSRRDGGVLQTAAMFEWPMTDAAEPVVLSEDAMTTLAIRNLTMAGIDARAFGLVIQPLSDEGRLRVDHLGAQPFNPASTMKLVTTHAALSLLGPNYQWATRFYTTGVLRDGTLHGDLIMQGGGDPRLLIEDLRALIGELRAGGLHTIRGNLVIDDSRFSAPAAGGSAFDGDASQAYNVHPYAALMNFKATRLYADPKRRELTIDPPLADVQLRYEVKVLKGRCRAVGGRVGVHESIAKNGKPVITVRGTQVRACGPQQFHAAVLDHQRFVHGIFKAAWQEAGGKFQGRTVLRPGAAKRARPFLTWMSASVLGDVVRDINKYSNNVMTRMLLLEMAAARGQGAVTSVAAGRWLHQWYRSQGLPMSSLVIENGSGLSRLERISANDMVAVLKHAARNDRDGWFEASLPVVGIDGTMRTRLRHDPVAGQAQMKTGTLSDVRAIAGYVTAASGQRYAVSLMINGRFDARRALAGQDELLRWVYQNG
ncbi:MAG: D-alanyl-D-alanine carboxypeptidase/D-alanyl-D-alanine-endopeptidase [Lautropia sp.]|nr:D-alanyl-D-alanine carboxypeptidase/D-alanyl-D-alanine-endopeptidase [Lautropia sp.]